MGRAIATRWRGYERSKIHSRRGKFSRATAKATALFMLVAEKGGEE